MDDEYKIKKHPIMARLFALILIFVFTLQSMPQINKHAFTTGFSNMHYDFCSIGIICCFGTPSFHMSYECGKPFHLVN